MAMLASAQPQILMTSLASALDEVLGGSEDCIVLRFDDDDPLI